MSLDLFNLLLRLHDLKLVGRAGWNKEFPPSAHMCTRCVPGAESVADHSWGLAMYAFALATALRLNAEKMVIMALIHDVPEIITLDGTQHHTALNAAERAQAKEERLQQEEAAAVVLFRLHGEFGAKCLELWREYERQDSPEARLVW